MIPSLEKGLTLFVQDLLDDLNRLIGPVYLVGGALRDCVRDGPFLSRDLNILVPRPLTECSELLLENGYESVVVGTRHNSLLLPLKRQDHPNTVEISTFRHRPGQKPTITEDLRHRDITANAMAYKWPDGPLYDPFDGQADLAARRVRFVDGSDTLEGDPPRGMRFFRFLFELDGYPDDADVQHAEQVKLPASYGKRFRGEMDRIFDLPLQSIRQRGLFLRMFESQSVKSMLPELEALRIVQEESDNSADARQSCLDMLLQLDDRYLEDRIPLFDLRWASLLHELGKAVCTVERDASGALDYPGYEEETIRLMGNVFKRLSFSNRRSRRIESLVRNLWLFNLNPTERSMKRLLENNVPMEGVFQLVWSKCRVHANLKSVDRREIDENFFQILRRCKVLRKELSRISSHELALSGGDMLDLVRLPPGPWLSQLQEWLVDWVMVDLHRNQRKPLEDQVTAWMLSQNDLFSTQKYK
ncbi:MAG: CCA tRNA nucleotidyltransferase [Magnetococcales bacterium]|nr:CCA tRNA nucleotidyltransferase [Magnetococcales bacterium]